MLNKKKLNKGFFITFEGIDGSGKSTQIKKLKQNIKKKFIKKFYFTREPGGTNFGDEIRNLILNNNKYYLNNETQILLLAASRFEHCKNFIMPLLKRNKIVIADRFHDSTFAYQCENNKNLFMLLKSLNNMLLKDFEPNLTILLDLDPKEAIGRIKNRKSNNSFDNKKLVFYKNARNNYLKLAKKNRRIRVFDGLIDKKVLHNDIQKLIFNELKKNGFNL